MGAGKVVAYVAAGVLIIGGLVGICFGVMNISGSFSSQGQSSWIAAGIIYTIIGVIVLAGGVLLVILSGRGKVGGTTQNVTLQVDLPANVNLDTLKCKSCGGSLTMDNIQLVAGAPVVNCPYCKTTYQLSEEPKW